ncbi:tetratricopeptide repeat protein [Avibacterium paragallinarum]|uniref:SEL1-like repeat protein n=1 Tax=Avibacterium paragallinarum TaxID=728 RepID=A0ABU7QQB6_AVIPA|nr:SEL1-like repeat protein [Avibacterium paragallinarum]
MKMRKTIIASVVLALSLNAVAVNEAKLEKAKKGDYWAMVGVALDYCKEGNYREAFYWQENVINHLRFKANATDEDKENLEFYMTRLAEGYASGTCDPYGEGKGKQLFLPDYRLAERWYSSLAFIKNPVSSHPYNAKYKLADIYFWGKGGIEKNLMLAKGYYKELAELSDDVIAEMAKKDELNSASIQETRGNARSRLAQMYYFGNNAPQDDELAYQWAEKAKQDGRSYGAKIQAVLLYEGRGTKQNKQEALRLMRAVCDGWGDESACNWYQDMKANRPLRREGEL